MCPGPHFIYQALAVFGAVTSAALPLWWLISFAEQFADRDEDFSTNDERK